MRSGAHRPLKDFWVQAFPSTDFPGYAQAWSLIDFMTQSKDLRRKTGKFVLALKERAPERKGFVTIKNPEDVQQAIQAEAAKAFKLQADVFTEIFGVSVEHFEKRWMRYVLATY